jgi:hypothetical protein
MGGGIDDDVADEEFTNPKYWQFTTAVEMVHHYKQCITGTWLMPRMLGLLEDISIVVYCCPSHIMAFHRLCACYIQLTPWSWALLLVIWTLDSFPAFCGTRRFNNEFTRALHLSLSRARPMQSTSPHPTSIRSILILSNQHATSMCVNVALQMASQVDMGRIVIWSWRPHNQSVSSSPLIRVGAV